MLYSQKPQLDDVVTELLVAGEKSAQQLFADERVKAFDVSIQALYKTLKKLVAIGVVVKHRKYFAVSKEWTEVMREQLATGPVLSLAEGERATYIFTSFDHTDAYWKQIAYSIPEAEQRAPAFVYMPHNFWLYIPSRYKSELLYYQAFDAHKQYGFFTVGGDTAADREVASWVKSDYVKVNTISYKAMNRTDHVVVMGTYVITTRLENDLAEKIDHLYETCPGEEVSKKLQLVFEEPTRIRIIVEHSPRKAKRLKKLLAKDFFIPPKVRNALQP